MRTIIGGDFNARGEMEKRERMTKDGKVNKEGKRLVEFVEERGCGLLNGCTKGDEEGEFTFTGGKGNTIIDFMIIAEEVRDRVKRMRVDDRIDSDHRPIEVWIKGEMWERGKKRDRKAWRGVWNDERKEIFKQKMERVEIGEGELEEEWVEIGERMKEIMKEMELERG